jgi:2-polyprenyl-6-methoxyphenol hydroxylase-like FAD-dependent oxidoreductase
VPVRLDRLPTEYPYTLMVPQNVTEQVLLDRLEELDGQGPPSLRRHTGLSETADGAEVTLDSGDKIKAQYVAAADGMNRCERGPAGCVRRLPLAKSDRVGRLQSPKERGTTALARRLHTEALWGDVRSTDSLRRWLFGI